MATISGLKGSPKGGYHPRGLLGIKGPLQERDTRLINEESQTGGKFRLFREGGKNLISAEEVWGTPPFKVGPLRSAL